MATVVHERRWLNRGDLVIVECDHQCDIRLIDDRNFQEFREGRRHQYYGGFYPLLPARIVVPSSGDWNIVVDLGGRLPVPKHAIKYMTAKAQAIA